MLGWFHDFNNGKNYPDQIKPANFLLLAHPDSLDPSPALPMTPFQRDASKWETNPWTDRRTGSPIRITTEPFDGMERKGTVRVRTYRDVLAQFLAHPEAKSLGPDGEPVARNTRGLLQRRPVEGILPVMRLGKESNKLDDLNVHTRPPYRSSRWSTHGQNLPSGEPTKLNRISQHCTGT